MLSVCFLLWLKMPSSKDILTLQMKTSHCGLSEISSYAVYKRIKHLFDAVKMFCSNDCQKVWVYGLVVADLMTQMLPNTRFMGKGLSCPCPHSFKTEDWFSKLSSHLEKEKSCACVEVLQGVECRGLHQISLLFKYNIFGFLFISLFLIHFTESQNG